MAVEDQPSFFITAFFGFVCFPVLSISLVLTQFLWSLFVFDPSDPTPSISFIMLLLGLLVTAVLLACSCQSRRSCLYTPRWSLLHGKIFQGQLVLGMGVAAQLLCGLGLGLCVAWIDESELVAHVVLSSDTLAALHDNDVAVRGAALHSHQDHVGLYVAFLLHGWVWVGAVSYALGEWSNAAALHSAAPALHLD